MTGQSVAATEIRVCIRYSRGLDKSVSCDACFILLGPSPHCLLGLEYLTKAVVVVVNSDSRGCRLVGLWVLRAVFPGPKLGTRGTRDI